MKLAICFIFTFVAIVDPVKIGKVNSAKSEARKAYTSGNYKEAVSRYRYLADSLNVTEDEVMLNLANSYFQTNDTTNAAATYQSLIGSPKPEIRSKSQQQLGVMNHRQGKLEEALNNFKQAIKADANNIDARYNYEMLKKKLDEEKKKQQQQDKQNRDKENKEQQKDQQQNKDQKKDQEQKDQQKKDQEKKDKQEKEQQQKDQQQKDQKDQQSKEQKEKSESEKQKENKDQQKTSPQLAKKLQEINMSPEKAKMVLDAMKNQEIQYLQQNKRKATKPREKNKPDW